MESISSTKDEKYEARQYQNKKMSVFATESTNSVTKFGRRFYHS